MRGYIPDFKLAFDHFCLHTGGRGVIDAIEKQLELLPEHVGPSRETLYRYGNISSSSIWCGLRMGGGAGRGGLAAAAAGFSSTPGPAAHPCCETPIPPILPPVQQVRAVQH